MTRVMPKKFTRRAIAEHVFYPDQDYSEANVPKLLFQLKELTELRKDFRKFARSSEGEKAKEYRKNGTKCRHYLRSVRAELKELHNAKMMTPEQVSELRLFYRGMIDARTASHASVQEIVKQKDAETQHSPYMIRDKAY